MKLFFHHVGQQGSIDLEKTVFKEISISLVEENIPLGTLIRDEVLQTLRAKFP